MDKTVVLFTILSVLLPALSTLSFYTSTNFRRVFRWLSWQHFELLCRYFYYTCVEMVEMV